MSALLYLYRRSFCNRVKKALRKPATYFFLIFFGLYFFLLPYSFRVMLEDWKLDSPEGMVIVYAVFAIWIIPTNFVAYARRKGLLFRRSDIHFLFPSPISPKTVLLYTHLKTQLTNLIWNIILFLAGLYLFRVALWRMVFYFLFATLAENVLEASLVLVLYGSERLGEKRQKGLMIGAYALIGILVLLGLGVYLKEGLSGQWVRSFLGGDAIQLVPVIGWYIAVLHLLFLDPTPVSVAGGLLYFGLTAVLFAMAVRMRCLGDYYEDAEKFADDYEEAVEKRRQGRTDVRIGKRNKLGKAHIVYRGSGARALFYRQLLEYKKSRFFLLDFNTLVNLGVGIGIAFLYCKEGGFGDFNDFILPAAMAYVVLIFAGYTGKWGKELLSPYTYLIPDNAFRKLFYATVIQHIQALINGILFVLPPALVMGQPLFTLVLSVLSYVLLCACKLYAQTVAEVAVGGVLGQMGKQFFKLFLLGIIITAAAGMGILGYMMGGINLAYLLILVLLAGALAILMTISTLCFYRMEMVQ